MSIIDRSHGKQLRRLVLASQRVLNLLGPKAESEKEEMAVAELFLATQTKSAQALLQLEQLNIPYHAAEEESLSAEERARA